MTARTPFHEAFQSSVEGFQDYVLRVVPHQHMCPYEWSNLATWLQRLVHMADRNRANITLARYVLAWDGTDTRRFQIVRTDAGLDESDVA